jgi:hypothetical protein
MRTPLRLLLALILLPVGLAACSDGGTTAPPTPPPSQPPPPPPPPPPTQPDLAEGERLFDHETFGGNGRTCMTCHMVENGTITLEAVAERFAADPDDALFRHDGLDDGFAGARRILAHGTIRVELELPPHVSLVDNPSQRSIVVLRGVPTTMNTPALDQAILMYDLRDTNLQDQARGAIRAHAQTGVAPTPEELDAIAAFQQQDRRFFSSDALFDFANGGSPPRLPTAQTPSEQRGRLFFEDVPLTAGSKQGVCGFCHGGHMLNEITANGAAETGFRVGQKFSSALVAEANALDNPVYTFQVIDGRGVVRTVALPDPGILLTAQGAHIQAFLPPVLHPAELAGFFKTPSLWGVKHTAPYFHDNSAKTLREVVDHYGDVFFVNQPIAGQIITLTEQDRQDIVAFLERF